MALSGHLFHALTAALRLMPAVVLIVLCCAAATHADAPDSGDEPARPAAERKIPPAELCGFLAAHQRLGRMVPLGRGIEVGLVEPSTQKYMPDAARREFRGKTLVPRSGSSKISGHANVTATTAWGQDGLAPGVKDIHCFEVHHWLTEGYLRTGTALPPQTGPVRVFNHSWINNRSPGAEQVLRRVDYAIDANDVIMCVGVNNNRNTQVPELLAQAYNVIAVGSTRPDGSPNSSGGYTTIDGPAGRCKPDIVGPPARTSFTTPMVSAAVTRLLEAADRRETPEQQQIAGKPQVIKAALMTGAVKTDAWRPQPGKPLDQWLGAGRLHFDRALQIHEQGPIPAGEQRGEKGWDFAQLAPNQHLDFPLTVPADMAELAVSVVWHRRIDPAEIRNLRTGERSWMPIALMPQFTLELLGPAAPDNDASVPPESLAAASRSPIDNVQHIYLRNPQPGRYLIRVHRVNDGSPGDWPFALAWWMSDNPEGS